METMEVKEENKPDETNTTVEKTPSKFTIVKNASVLSVAIMLYLSANLPCSELQSSINIKDGLGVYAGTVTTFVDIFAYLTLPTLFVNKLGLKRTITLGLMIVTVYYFANLYATWGTMIPAAVISSLANAPLWPIKALYLTILAEQASKAFDIRKDHAISLMFGFFYGFYYFGYIWGNIASYFILMPSSESNTTEEELGKCGLYFCDSDGLDGSNSNFTRPSDKEIYILFGAFIGLTLFAALIVALFMDPLKATKSNQSVVQLVFRTIRDMAKPKHILLLPLSVLRGVSKVYMSTEYTKSFVSCAWGIHYIGLVMISFGVACGISSLLLGKIVRYTGRIPLFTSAVIFHIVIAIIITKWRPNTDQTYLLFVVPILQGYCNSVWESQVSALYAIMFPDDREVIFSIYCVASSVGQTIASSYSATLCTQYKLLIYMIMVGVGYDSRIASGLVMISFGVACGISSLLLGKIVRYTGRIPLFTSAVIFHIVIAIIITKWRPNTDQTYLLFVVPILQGYCNSVWESQVSALYAIMFPDDREVIFSIYCVASSVGQTIASSYSATLCTQYKLLIYMIMVGVGYCCYMVAEFKYLRYRVKK